MAANLEPMSGTSKMMPVKPLTRVLPTMHAYMSQLDAQVRVQRVQGVPQEDRRRDI